MKGGERLIIKGFGNKEKKNTCSLLKADLCGRHCVCLNN